MKTVTITSQGQITIPAKARRVLELKPADELEVVVDPISKKMTLRKPFTLDDFEKAMAPLRAKAAKAGVKPIPADKLHEYYEIERTKEIMANMRENL